MGIILYLTVWEGLAKTVSNRQTGRPSAGYDEVVFLAKLGDLSLDVAREITSRSKDGQGREAEERIPVHFLAFFKLF